MIKAEVQFPNISNSDAFIFLYPVGMVAKNIRKGNFTIDLCFKEIQKEYFFNSCKFFD